MSKEIITASQYAEKIGLSIAYITKCLEVEEHLPGAKKVEKIGNTWCITVNGDINAEHARDELKPIYKRRKPQK